jgi:citrate synthase
VGGSKRNRRYRSEDIQKLKERKAQRRDPGQAVATALHWGLPVMESGLTLIAEGKLYYRGQDATGLAMTHSLEQVAALIWAGQFESELWHSSKTETPFDRRELHKRTEGLSAIESFQAALPMAAAQDVAAYDLRPTAVAQTGLRILRLLASLAASRPVGGNIAAALAQGWAPNDDLAPELINRALILCADHELNVSAFTARCVASAGATPYQVVIAGLAAVQGPRHGRQSEYIDAFLNEAKTPKAIRTTLVNRLKRGEPIPGFGHPLYPQGDPRAVALLKQLRESYPKSSAMAFANAASRAAFELLGEYPNIDFALVILARALHLPPGSALTLFALGRTVGWIGHALEQYRSGELIRPRARYVGQPPAEHST